ncbi:LysE family translocator [Rhizobium sp. BK176]|uniref:LysE family translocator n=1 Tax=Rhizobium sp. BK176 TaxID=2587071 RepID=UPI002168FF95|nr:LysE family transporter [Rhizobium sp. BK176]MCS4090165.1 threonine/homoserine/homoserine lactone efflux protein [Rhizobium sp. BK176]
MHELSAFVVQVLLLLVVPGPTNTLLCLSGREKGFLPSLRLLVGETAGYLAVIVPLVTFLAPVLDERPSISLGLKAAAAFWILYMATKLWKTSNDNASNISVTVLRVFVTTILNPKALVFGLVIFPRGQDVPLHLAAFLGTLVPVAILWMGGGAVAGRSSRYLTGKVFRRLASACLVVFSAVLIRSVALA